MVFGYYSVTVQRIKNRDIPSSFNLGPRAIVKQVAKLGHIMWIPIFPIGSNWLAEIDGKDYQMLYHHELYFKNNIKSKGKPWYSFLAFIIFGLLLIIGETIDTINSWSNAAKRKESRIIEKEKDKEFEAKRRRSIVSLPSENQLYYIKDIENNSIVLKLNSITDELVTFKAAIPEAKLGFTLFKYNFGYFQNEKNPTILKSITRNEFDYMLMTFAENFNVQWLSFPGISQNEIQLYDILNIPDSKSDWPEVDKVSELEIEKMWNDFVNQYSETNNSIQFFSQSSFEFYRDIIKLSKTNSKNQVKEIKKSEYPNMIYELLLYTGKYFSERKMRALDNKELVKYILSIRKLNKGIWKLSKDNLQNTIITNVKILGQDKAMISLKAPANIIETNKMINFSLNLEKEGENWKIFIPSGYKYDEGQINAKRYDEGGERFRKSVRDNLEKEIFENLPVEWIF